MRPRAVVLSAMLAALVLAAAPPPDDPHYAQQWGLRTIGVQEAWEQSRGEGIVVAVLDTGVAAHPDLVDALVRDADGRVVGLDLVDGGDDPTDEHGHGTMIAGIIAARTGNAIGVASVAPAARILPVRVLDHEAVGRSRDVDAGIRWAVDQGAHVVNLSLEVARGEDADAPGVRSHAPDAAVRYAWERGVVVVAAAGNDASDFTDYPDDSPVVLVGATDRDDSRAPFSDAGRTDMLMAPGVGIVSTWCDPCGASAIARIGQASGTSYAAAHVSGAVALLLGVGLTPQEAVDVLRSTTVDLGAPGPDPLYGHGRIDVAKAMRVAAGRVEAADDDTPDQAASPSPSDADQPTVDDAPAAPDGSDETAGASPSPTVPEPPAAPSAPAQAPPAAVVEAPAPGPGTAAPSGAAVALIALYAALFARWRREERAS